MEDRIDKLIIEKLRENPSVSDSDLITFLFRHGVQISLDDLSRRKTELVIRKTIEPQPPGAQPTLPVRPSGVKAITALEVINGFALLGFGGLYFTLVVLLGELEAMGGELPPEMEQVGAIIEVIGPFIGSFLLLIGLLSFVVAYGFWKGRGWAWTLGLIFSIIGIMMGIFLLPAGVILVIVCIAIIYYLRRPQVKNYFGKAAPPTQPQIV